MSTQRKQVNFPKSFMIWSCMLLKGLMEIALITSTINAHVYIEILDNFLIPLTENWFGDCILSQRIGYESFFLEKVYKINDMTSKQYGYKCN